MTPSPATSAPGPVPEAATRSHWRRVTVVSLGLAALVSILLIAFALPNANTEARDLPVAVVATDDVAAQLEAGLEAAMPGAFTLTSAASTEEARDLISDRRAYGAFVIGPEGHTLLTASAASPTISTMLTQVAQGMAASQGIAVEVEDVVAFPSQDPRGAGLAAGALPLAVGGLFAGVAITLLIAGAWQRLAAALAFSLVGGAAMVAVLQYWVGTFDGNYVLTSLAASLGLVATAAAVLGLARLLGNRGFAIAGLLIFVLGNPLSGLSSAPDLLPRPWGTIGQLLPPGATGTLLRHVVFFDGAAIAVPLAVLCGWTALGIALFALGERRSRVA